jgi:hypothetical protein
VPWRLARRQVYIFAVRKLGSFCGVVINSQSSSETMQESLQSSVNFCYCLCSWPNILLIPIIEACTVGGEDAGVFTDHIL